MNYKFYKHQDGLFSGKYVMVYNTITDRWFAVYMGETIAEKDCEPNYRSCIRWYSDYTYQDYIKDGTWVEIARPTWIKDN